MSKEEGVLVKRGSFIIRSLLFGLILALLLPFLFFIVLMSVDGGKFVKYYHVDDIQDCEKFADIESDEFDIESGFGSISFESEKGYCVALVAQRNHNLGICRNINDEYYFQSCLEFFFFKNNDIRSCSSLMQDSILYDRMGRQTLDYEICQIVLEYIDDDGEDDYE